MQYCLWDFLRDLGETDIGGQEMMKNQLQASGGFGGKKNVTDSKVVNVARAYAWWIAKGCTTLAILKVSRRPGWLMGMNFIFHRLSTSQICNHKLNYFSRRFSANFS